MMNILTPSHSTWPMVVVAAAGLVLVALAAWYLYRHISVSSRSATSRASNSTLNLAVLVTTVTALVVGLGATVVGVAVASQALPMGMALSDVGGSGGMGGIGMGGRPGTNQGMGIGRKSVQTDAASALASCPTATRTGGQAVFNASGMVMGRGMGRAYLSPTTSAAPAGRVTVTLINAGGQPHELVVLPMSVGQVAGARAVGADAKLSEVGALGEVHPVCPTAAGEGDTPAGGVSQVTLELPAGTYEVVCNLPGHYASGMYATLVVR